MLTKYSIIHKEIHRPLPYVVFYICGLRHVLDVALTGVLNLSTCTQKISFLLSLTFPRCKQRKVFRLERKERAWKIILHSQIDVEPLDSLPWNRWYCNMRTALLTDPSISRLCWESSTSLQRGLLSQNCQMATPPFMWKGSWSLQKRQHSKWYVLCYAIAKWHFVTLSLMLSFSYHWEHDIETSLTIYYNNVRDHMPPIRSLKTVLQKLTHYAFRHCPDSISTLQFPLQVSYILLEKKGKVKCCMNISHPHCLIAHN